MHKPKKYEKVLFAAYCILMLWLLYGQRMGSSANAAVNFLPLKTIKNYVKVWMQTSNPAMVKHIVINLVGNVVMFVPLGFFLPVIWNSFRRFNRHLLGCTLIIVLIELVQYFTMLGSMDIDDLILNLPGTVIGYVLWFLFRRGHA